LLFTEVGLPDGIHVYEDLGYTAASFISPACHREMILPYHKKLFSFFKDHGLPIILHTCGDFRPHLPAIVESGVDCIQAMEAKTGMNVVELAKEYKTKLCFMGNLDIRAFESGDRGKIREECMGKLNGMKAIRAPYIFMSDHSIPPSVKLADYEYALELYRANCRY
jgi:uroporphyrinogen decarboxylase